MQVNIESTEIINRVKFIVQLKESEIAEGMKHSHDRNKSITVIQQDYMHY
jgi:hypothetical protein